MSARTRAVPNLKRSLLLTGVALSLLPVAAASIALQRYAAASASAAQEVTDAAASEALDDHIRLTAASLELLPDTLTSEALAAGVLFRRIATSSSLSTFATYGSQARLGTVIFAAGGQLKLDPTDCRTLARVARQQPGRLVHARFDAVANGRHTAVKVAAQYLNRQDWVLAAAVPEGHLLQRARLAAIPGRTVGWLFAAMGTLVLLSASVWFLLGRRFSARCTPVKVHEQVVPRGQQYRATLDRLLHSARKLKTLKSQPSQRVRRPVLSAAEFERRSREILAELQTIYRTMSDLDGSNIHISAMVKTVDEIAFQSRLLALNASIESSRAGSSGASLGALAKDFDKLTTGCAEVAGKGELLDQTAADTDRLKADLRALQNGLLADARAAAASGGTAASNFRPTLRRRLGFWQNASLWLLAFAANRKPSWSREG